MSGLVPIPAAHLCVCKMGAGAATCRYLTVADAFACAKHSTLQPYLDARVAAGTLSAQGDNCPGLGSD